MSLAHNKLYRNFIILQEDEKSNTSSGDKALSGYAKIEAKGDKCKITFYAQNLKKEDNYSMVLICYQKDMKQVVDLGSLKVNEVGKGEACKEYYVNNIAGLDFDYEKVSGAAICKQKNGELNFLMYGFMNGENITDNWKKCKVVKNDEKNETVLKEKLEIKKPSENKDLKKEKEKEKEVKKDKDEKTCKGEKGNSEGKCGEHKSHNDDHEHEHGCKGCEQRSDGISFDEYETRIEEKKDIDPYNFELRGSMGEFFNGIVDGFEEIKDVFKEIKYCKWYKVPVNNLDDMCNISNYNKYTIAYYPMINYYPYIKDHGHFMLGYKCDDKGELKYIVYAVPGKKESDGQPYAGKTGFVTWMSGESGKTGYWLMFYDYKNSTIVVPMK